MEISWAALFSAALSGGLVVKAIDILYEALKSRHQSRKTAKAVVDAHLDPLLKAADEIVGKTRSLAERDFSALIQHAGSKSDLLSTEFIGLIYLYAQFWSRIEILRRDSLGVSISMDKRGQSLKEFLECLESQRIRLVNRVHQKAIGEITTTLDDGGGSKTIGVVKFKNIFTTDNDAKAWIAPLMEILNRVKQKRYRQRLLVYGVVLHALIDTLDPRHQSTHERPSYPNKLSKQSCRDIKYRVFGRYLKEVKNKEKYVG